MTPPPSSPVSKRKWIVCESTECGWAGARLAPGAPCPHCGGSTASPTRGRGRPPTDRVELRIRPRTSTIAALGGPQAAARKIAALIDLWVITEPCARCGGTGGVEVPDGEGYRDEVDCPKCNGYGYTHKPTILHEAT